MGKVSLQANRKAGCKLLSRSFATSPDPATRSLFIFFFVMASNVEDAVQEKWLLDALSLQQSLASNGVICLARFAAMGPYLSLRAQVTI